MKYARNWPNIGKSKTMRKKSIETSNPESMETVGINPDENPMDMEEMDKALY